MKNNFFPFKVGPLCLSKHGTRDRRLDDDFMTFKQFNRTLMSGCEPGKKIYKISSFFFSHKRMFNCCRPFFQVKAVCWKLHQTLPGQILFITIHLPMQIWAGRYT